MSGAEAAGGVATTVLWELDGAIGEITLNRPEKMNAVNDALVADLHRCPGVAGRRQGVLRRARPR